MPKLRRLTHETLLDRTGMPIDAPLGLPTKVKPIKLLAAPRTGATGKARRWDQVDARQEQRGNITVPIDAPLGLPTKVKPIKLLAAPRTGATGKARRWDQVDARQEQSGNITVL